MAWEMVPGRKQFRTYDGVDWWLNLGLFWLRDHAELLHHRQIVPYPPMLDGLAIPEAHEVHVILPHRATGRRHTHQRTFMGAAHAQTSRDGIAFRDKILDLEVQVRERRAKHGNQPARPLGAAIHSGRGLVVEEVGCDDFLCDLEVAPLNSSSYTRQNRALFYWVASMIYGSFLSFP